TFSGHRLRTPSSNTVRRKAGKRRQSTMRPQPDHDYKIRSSLSFRPDPGRTKAGKVKLFSLTGVAIATTTAWHDSILGCVLTARYRQSGQRAGAGAKLVGLDAQSLEHANVKIAERRRVLRVKRQMLTMAEAAAGEQDG